MESPETTSLDPIGLSVLRFKLESLVDEMGETLLRTACSQILNSSRDFSTAICDGIGRVIGQAEHVPIHVGAVPWAVQAVAGCFADVADDDVFAINDPYYGNNHLPDLTVIAPIGARASLGWAVVRAHQSDIGGAAHGGYNPAATEIWQEGLRIPPLRIIRTGQPAEDVLRLLDTNVRHKEFLGDLNAMIGAVRYGASRTMRLAAAIPKPGWQRYVDGLLDATELQAREEISRWTDGVYRGEALLDDDGHGQKNIRVVAEVRKSGSDLVVDLSESDDQVAGFVNSSFANMMASVRMAIAFLLGPDTPRNDGAFRVVNVIAREGSVVWAREPGPVGLCTSHCGQDIAEAVLKALAPACPDRAIAGWSKRFRLALRGVDPRSNRPFIWHLFHGRGGAGASAGGDGWHGVGESHTAGGIKFASVEITEGRFPLFFRRHEFRAGSGGAGQFLGGAGSVLELEVQTSTPVLGVTAGDGVRGGPYGLFGGRAGKPHRYSLQSRTGISRRRLKSKQVEIDIQPGDVLIVQSAGGGGFGPPHRRSGTARQRDRAEGLR